MSDFNAIGATARIYRKWGTLKLGLTAAAAAIAAALLGGVQHSQAYADSPTPSPSVHASRSTDASSQALRRYTLQLLHILSDADTNKWERYRQAMPHCAAAPAYLDEINANNDVSPLDATLIALTEDLCADLDQRLDDARTVGLLVNESQAMRGYTLIAARFKSRIHLIDHSGRIVHEWRKQLRGWVPHAKLLDNGNLLIEQRTGMDNRIITEIDPDGNIVWQFPYFERLHHDFIKMPNGNVLILARGTKTSEEAIAAGIDPDIVPPGGVNYDYLMEVRPTGSEGGEIVWEWSAWDYLAQDIDSSKNNYRVIAEHPELIDANFTSGKWGDGYPIYAMELTYINGIDYNPELDHIALSARYYSELWIIDHSATTEEAPTRTGGNAGKGGALLYRWGNPRAYRHGTTDDQRLFRQHHTQWIAPGLPGEGNILVFNNGFEWGADSPGHSSIEEIIPPLDGYGYRREPGEAYPPAEPVWTYTAEPASDFYSRIMSGVQRLPNGNTLICEAAKGTVFQVTPDGKTVWKYVYPITNQDIPLKQGDQPTIRLGNDIFNNAVYRAYWYAPDHPGLQKYDLTPGDAIELYE